MSNISEVSEAVSNVQASDLQAANVQAVEIAVAPRKLPRQQRSRTTVDAVLTAAELLLERGGPFTTNHIAQRAGVSVGSLYQYFPNKQAIVAALEERRAARTVAFSA